MNIKRNIKPDDQEKLFSITDQKLDNRKIVKRCTACNVNFVYDTGTQSNCYITQFETRCPHCDKRERE